MIFFFFGDGQFENPAKHQQQTGDTTAASGYSPHPPFNSERKNGEYTKKGKKKQKKTHTPPKTVKMLNGFKRSPVGHGDRRGLHHSSEIKHFNLRRKKQSFHSLREEV